MNHQIDSDLMKSIGDELARRFKGVHPTRILTAETSGIVPALAVGMVLSIPVIFARKHRLATMPESAFRQTTVSHTHGGSVDLYVSTDYLTQEDRVLIIDDFLATARTINALIGLVEQSQAKVVGIGCVIEKAFEGGRAAIKPLGVQVESLAVIKSFENGEINLA